MNNGAMMIYKDKLKQIKLREEQKNTFTFKFGLKMAGI